MKRKLENIKEPCAQKKPRKIPFGNVKNEYRGTNLIEPVKYVKDDYYYMQDRTRKNKSILKYIDEENNYTKTIMKSTEPKQKKLYENIISRINEEDKTYPYKINTSYSYYQQIKKNQSYPIYYRKLNSKITKLLDVNKLAQNKKTCDVTNVLVNQNEKVLSYAIDYKGDEKYSIIFVKIYNKLVIDRIENILYGLYDWINSDEIIYCSNDENLRVNQVWAYNIKTKQKIKIFEENDQTYEVSFEISNDKTHLFIESRSYEASKVYRLRFGFDKEPIKIDTKTKSKIDYCVDIHHKRYIKITNEDSLNYKLMISKNDYSTDFEDLDTILNTDEYYLTGLFVLKNYLIVKCRKNGFLDIAIIKYQNNKYQKPYFLKKLFNKNIQTIHLDKNFTSNTDTLRVRVQSLITSPEIYDINLKTKKLKLLVKKNIPNFNPKLYDTRILTVNGVNIQLLYKKSLELTKQTYKTHIYGYGAYGINIDPTFNSDLFSLIDQDYIYAIVNVHGGSEKGKDWYNKGKLDYKINSFDDLINSVEYLIQNNYTTSKQVSIEGRSAGGLLVCGAMCLRPDLFNTVIAGVPFVDVLNSMSDPTIPLTAPEWNEWGNPNQQYYFDYIKKYCPYQNIKKTNYPNLLMLSGLYDPRVQYWEHIKFIAKLRSQRKNKKTVLLKTNKNAGHFGSNDRYKHYRDTAFLYAFLLSN
jgi:oligopeptidase B